MSSEMRGVGVQRPKTYSEPASVPSNYVAGLGRGATGFTTRSDIGPARPAAGTATKTDEPPPGYVPGLGRGARGMADEKGMDKGDYSESNYDSFSGYRESLFGDANAADDIEAEGVYASVDDYMDGRRRKRREEAEKERMKQLRKGRPKITEQFADLKRQLVKVSDEEWNAIPDIGDRSLARKQRREEYSARAPDSLLASALNQSAKVNALEKGRGGETPYSGAATNATPMSGLSAARGQMLSLKMDKVADSVSGQTVVDPKGYLTDLNSLKVTSDAEIGDIKKARLLLKSVTSTNPKHPPGWIAAARLEEVAGKMQQARRLIAKGCEACPDNEDVWLENVRLQAPDRAKVVLADAVRHVPHSVNIWLRAASMEEDAEKRKLVLRRALEFIPNSVKLWKSAVELEEPEDARVMLARAVECVPRAVELWLALARLEDYENAKRVLNKAREHIPTDPKIWITAAQLEEAHGNSHMVERIIQKAVRSLSAAQVVITREQWLKEAEKAEEGGSAETSGAIVRCTIGIGVEEVDQRETWLDDAEGCAQRGNYATARAIYAHTLAHYGTKKSVWLAAIGLEQKHGTAEAVEGLLKRAVSAVPRAEILWLMAAKHKWRTVGDVDGSRTILREAFRVNPDSEDIWLAAVKLEWENGEFARARALLARARERASTARIWMKSALLEWEVGDYDAERKMLEEGLRRYPEFDKMWMMLGQMEEERGGDVAARDAYRQGLRNCPGSVPLWQLAARLELRTNGVVKARTLLELARLKNPKSDPLWLEAVRMEQEHGDAKLAASLMAKALQDCPASGVLRAQDISMAPRPEQKRRSVDALKQCENDVHVVVSVALLFWRDRKQAKARKWLTRAVKLRPDYGDGWAYLYKFELVHGTEEQQSAVLSACERADPNRGERWDAVAKAKANRRKGPREVLQLVAAQLTVV